MPIFQGRGATVSRPRVGPASTAPAASADAVAHGQGSAARGNTAHGPVRGGAALITLLVGIFIWMNFVGLPVGYGGPFAATGAGFATYSVVSVMAPSASGTATATTTTTASTTAAASQSASSVITPSSTAASSLSASATVAPSIVVPESQTASVTAAASLSSTAAATQSTTTAASPSPSSLRDGSTEQGADASPTHTDGALVVPRALPTLPAARNERAALLRTSASARQRFWYDCLAASSRPACRPDPAAVGAPGSDAASVMSIDAWRRHVRDVLVATARYRTVPVSSYAGYSGPWIENVFISHFLPNGDGADALNWTALDVFYPVVPIFAQWTDGTFGPDRATHDPALEWMRSGGDGLLRSTVLYAALSQHDRGEPASGLPCMPYRNVVVFSGGGWGSVPIPLIMGTREHVRGSIGAADVSRPGDFTSLPRALVASFVGSMWLGRDAMSVGYKGSTLPAGLVSIGSGEWRSAARRSVFVMAPRGYGRSSFRLYEMLQFGRVPIYLGDDSVWVPHQHTLDMPFSGLEVAAGSRAPELLPPIVDGIDLAFYGAVAPGLGATTNGSTAAGATSRILNDGGMWGPGGVGFAMRYADIPAFMCVACELITPGSADRWRGVRVLPLHTYAPGRVCPCDRARWETTIASLSPAAGASDGSSGSFVLPADSLVAEMERRIVSVTPSFFTYDAVVRNVGRMMADPLYDGRSSSSNSGDGGGNSGSSSGDVYESAVAASAPLRCVPKPNTYGVPDAPHIERRRRRLREVATGGRGGPVSPHASDGAAEDSTDSLRAGAFSPAD